MEGGIPKVVSEGLALREGFLEDPRGYCFGKLIAVVARIPSLYLGVVACNIFHTCLVPGSYLIE